MGNYLSCTLAAAGGPGRASAAARVVLPSGEVRQYDGPVSAAELMLDAPSHFLVSAAAMRVGRRLSALAADEDLEVGGVYVMLPMRRVNSAATAADMGALLLAAAAASSGKKRARGQVAEAAVAEACRSADREEEGRVEKQWRLEEVEGVDLGELKRRMSCCRSRKPMLETIAEESICSR